jgi:hypothetical protein
MHGGCRNHAGRSAPCHCQERPCPPRKAVGAGAVSGEEVAHAADAVRTARPRWHWRRATAPMPKRRGRGQPCQQPAVLAAIAAVRRRHRARAHAYRGRSGWRRGAAQRAAWPAGGAGRAADGGGAAAQGLGRRQFPRNPACRSAHRPAATMHADAYGRKDLPRQGDRPVGGFGQRLCPAARAERQRQLDQDRPARAGAHRA